MADTPKGPAARVSFLLALVPYLIAKGGAYVEEIAEEFGIPEAEVRSAVALLPVSGIPGETGMYMPNDLFDIDYDQLDADDFVALTNTVAIDRSPRFTTQEVATILVGLSLIAAALPDALKEVATSAMHKLGAAVPLQNSAQHIHRELSELQRALDTRTVVEIDYVGGSGAASSRSIEPLALECMNGVWYVDAWSIEVGARRTFRIDRIRDIRHTTRGFTQPATTAHTRMGARGEHQLEVQVERTAQAFLTWFPTVSSDRVEPLGSADSAATRQRIVIGNEAAFVRSVMAYPGRVVVTRDESVRIALVDRATRALARYS